MAGRPDGAATAESRCRGAGQQDRPHGLGRSHARRDLPASGSIGAETTDGSSTVWQSEREVMQNRSNRGSGKTPAAENGVSVPGYLRDRGDLPPRTIPLFKLESVAMGRPDRAIARVQPMSALGQKRTSNAMAIYVRFWG